MVDRPTNIGDYDLEVGLADNFDGVIEDAYFATNPKYMDGSVPMTTLVIKSPTLGQAITQGYSCGDKPRWQIGKNGGEIVSSVNPDVHRFNMNSRSGELVKAMMTMVGRGDLKEGQKFFLSKGSFMTEAKFYTGLNFHWKRVAKPTPTEGVTSDVLLPDSYLGEVTVESAGVDVADDAILDELVTGLCVGKALTAREIKGEAVKIAEIKANAIYIRTLLDGVNKFNELVASGKLTEADGKYTATN